MAKFNNGKPYHGSPEVQQGRLKGSSMDTDYFYFFCPKCPEIEIMRVLEYTERERYIDNEYNEFCKSKAKYGFTLAFKIHCEKCGFTDFIKLTNMGYQGGSGLSYNE